MTAPVRAANGSDAGASTDTDEEAALDAYSKVVTRVAERVLPSVASLEVRDRQRGGRPRGSGSAVIFTPDGFLVTAAHVVAGAERASATFADGVSGDVDIVGADRLSEGALDELRWRVPTLFS